MELDLAPVWVSLHTIWRSVVGRIPYMVAAFLVVVAFWGIGRVARWTVQTAARRARLDAEIVKLFGTTASVLVTLLGVLVGFVIVFPGFAPGDLITGLGITSVAVGFAFKDILQNFFAGIFILWRRPFHIGDEIRTAEFHGTVEEINMRSTRVLTYDGERVVIPNADVYTKPVQVTTAYSTRRVQFTVGVAYPESVDAARDTIFRAVSGTQGVLTEPGPWVYLSELGDFAAIFRVYFWTGSRQANVLAVGDRVAAAIKRALDEAGIEIPYPRTVVYLQDDTTVGEEDRRRMAGATGDSPLEPRGTRGGRS